jgi:hypothetical protein
MKLIRYCLPLFMALALSQPVSANPLTSQVLLLANPNVEFHYLLQEVNLPKHPVLRNVYMEAIREHFNQDPGLHGKLRDAKKKARAITVEIYGKPQDGWIHHYWEIEKLIIKNEMGYLWWMTPMEADPSAFVGK